MPQQSKLPHLQINNNQSSAMVKEEHTWQPLTEKQSNNNCKIVNKYNTMGCMTDVYWVMS
jgi:hypothetical protein